MYIIRNTESIGHRPGTVTVSGVRNGRAANTSWIIALREQWHGDRATDAAVSAVTVRFATSLHEFT